MQTKFKDIAQYYFKTNLKIQWDSGYQTTHKTDFTIADYDWLINKQKGKPLLRSLDSLTKPITVKGYNDDKEFVPSEKLAVHLFDFDFIDMVVNKSNTNGIPFWVVKLLLQWQFNIFNLPETEYIKID